MNDVIERSGESETRGAFETRVLYVLGILILVDLPNVLEVFLRGVITIVVVVLFVRQRLRGTPMGKSLAERLFVVFLLYAGPGLFLSKIEGSGTSYLSMFFGILVVLILSSSESSPVRERISLGAITTIGFAWTIPRIILLSGMFPFVTWQPVTHEDAFLLPLTFLPALFTRRFVLAGWGVATALLLAVVDMRATFVAVLVVSLVTGAIFQFLPRKVNLAIVAVFICFVVFSPIISFDSMRDLSTDIRSAAGKEDTAQFREAIWLLGLSEFVNAPLVGSYFIDEAGYEFDNELGRVPLHNDFLEILLKGGIVGLTLFLGAMLAACVTGIRSLRQARTFKDPAAWALVAVLLVTLVNAMITMTFNPVINQPRSGFLVFMIVGTLLYTSRQVRLAWTRRDEIPARFETR